MPYKMASCDEFSTTRCWSDILKWLHLCDGIVHEQLTQSHRLDLRDMPPRECHTPKVEELTTSNNRRFLRRFGFVWCPIGLQISYEFNAMKNKSRRHNVNLWAIQNWLASIWSYRTLDWRMDQILKCSGEEKRTFKSGQCSEIANRDTSVMKVPPTLKCSSDCALLTCTLPDSAKRGTWSKNRKGVHG